MNNQSTNEVHTHKNLGVFLSSDCHCHDHLDYINSKVWSRINGINRVSDFRDFVCSLFQKTILFTFILLYCSLCCAVIHHSAGYILFSLGSLGPSSFF